MRCHRAVVAAAAASFTILSHGVAAADLPPAPEHVIIVIEENRSAGAIIGNARLPAIQNLISEGALFTNSHAIGHPSLPNYFALFAGRTNEDGDHCSDKPTDALGDLPVPSGFSARMPTLASELAAAHRTFVGFAESLPQPGYVGCYGRGGPIFSAYYKRHVPWAFFTKAGHPREVARDIDHVLLDDAVNQPWTAFPEQGRYDTLPTVAIVVPNLKHDMHGQAIGASPRELEAKADDWLARNIAPLAAWAEDPKNHALVIVTWDESDGRSDKRDTNQIPTILVGSMVRAGSYAELITHYSVLATIEDLYHLPRLGNSAGVAAIADCWKQGR